MRLCLCFTPCILLGHPKGTGLFSFAFRKHLPFSRHVSIDFGVPKIAQAVSMSLCGRYGFCGFWTILDGRNATVKTKEVLHSSFHLNFMSGKLLLDEGENKGETHHGETYQTITCFFVGKHTRVMTDPLSSFLDDGGTTMVLYTIGYSNLLG